MDHFDSVIHLGDVLTLLAVVVAWIVTFVRLETKVNIMFKWFEKHVLNGRKD